MSNRELLPCPFCGGEAELNQTGRQQLTIKCKSCQIKRVQKTLHFSLEWLEEKMVEAWNKRIPLIQVPGVKEMVEKAFKRGLSYTHYDSGAIDAEAREYMKALEDKR